MQFNPEFYSTNPAAQLLKPVNGILVATDIDLQPSEVSADEALSYLEDFSQNRDLIQDPETGKQFEILISNRDALSDRSAEVTVELASYTSAAAFPASNSLESIAAWLALEKATDVPQARVYASSPSMGGSDGFDLKDSLKIWRTGRVTEGDPTYSQPLPYLSALARALEAHSIKPTHATANSAGGFYLPGLLRALPENSIKSALFLDRAAGASSFGYFELANRMLRGELKHMRKYEALSDDPICITAELQERCNQAIDRPTLLAEGSLRVRDGALKTLGQKLLELNAYRKGADRHRGPVQDILVAAGQQPNAKFNFYFPLHSALLGKPEDIGRFLLQLVDGHIPESQLAAVTVEGTHSTKPGRPNTINAVELLFRA